ncbi:MAG: flagellar motor protein MotB [Planctomycetota bacterium]|jgi:flagellar motor protein MotB
MGDFKPDPKTPPPSYMVSFCDMMTLILTFFILLVSMAEEQQRGLAASGVGSFIVAIKSHGMNGIMSGKEEAGIFDEVRARFNVPSDGPPELLADATDASNLELIKSKLLKSLTPHYEIPFPNVVVFSPDSSEIPESGMKYVGMIAPSLHPKFRQLLIIEGHANDAGANHGGDNRLLASQRAAALRDLLVEEYGFIADRVEARAWHTEVPTDGVANSSVSIRLLTPESRSTDK